MKRKSLLFVLVIFFFAVIYSCNKDENTLETKGDEIHFNMRKGVNIGHWLSQTDVRGEQRGKNFTRGEVEYLSSVGFDHLRLPVDEEQLFTEDNKLDYEVVTLIHNFITWCSEFNMKVVLDLHILRSHHFDNPERPLWTDATEQKKFIEMWLAINNEFKKYPENILAFELLNEVVAPTNDDWNKLANKLIAELRKVAPKRKIVLAANWYNSISELKYLDVPKGDKNIILSFHFYEPFPLTHFHADWTLFGNFSVTTHYPGKLVRDEDYHKLTAYEKEIYGIYKEVVYNRSELKNRISEAVAVANKHNLQLYCGEFGCLLDADDASRYAWWSDMVSIFNEYGIAYTTWGYRGGFGFLNNDDSVLKDPKLLSILLNKK